MLELERDAFGLSKEIGDVRQNYLHCLDLFFTCDRFHLIDGGRPLVKTKFEDLDLEEAPAVPVAELTSNLYAVEAINAGREDGRKTDSANHECC